MISAKDEETLKRSSLFRNVSEKTVCHALKSGKLIKIGFPKGAAVVFGGPGLAILQKGRLKVGAREDVRKLTVSQMEEGAVFGFASLYERGPHFDTDIIAAGEAAVLFLPEALLEELIAEDGALAVNIIAMQAEKIRFLNRRVLSFSASSGVKKLRGYLASLPTDANGTAVLPMGMAPLAARLGMSRAGLYRAFSELEERGEAVKDRKRVVLRFRRCETEKEQ